MFDKPTRYNAQNLQMWLISAPNTIALVSQSPCFNERLRMHKYAVHRPSVVICPCFGCHGFQFKTNIMMDAP